MQILRDVRHPITQKNRLLNLFRKKSFCDLHLCSSDGTLFRTHRLVLALYSDYFRQFASLKKGPIGSRSSTEVVNLDVEACILSILLDYIYKGEFAIGPENQGKIWKAAKLLKLQDIVQLIDDNRELLGVSMETLDQPEPAVKQEVISPQSTARRKSRPRGQSLGKSGLRGCSEADQKDLQQITGYSITSQDYDQVDELLKVSMSAFVRHKQAHTGEMEGSKDWSSHNHDALQHGTETLETKFKPSESAQGESECVSTESQGLQRCSLTDPSSRTVVDSDEEFSGFSINFGKEDVDFVDDDDNDSDYTFKPSKSRGKRKSKSHSLKRKTMNKHTKTMSHILNIPKMKRSSFLSCRMVARWIHKKYYPFICSSNFISSHPVRVDIEQSGNDSPTTSTSSPKLHLCNVCGKEFSLISICRNHVLKKHIRNKSICQMANRAKILLTMNQESTLLRIQMKQNMNKLVNTKLELPQSSSRPRSKATKAMPSPFSGPKCADCGSVLSSRYSLKVHLENVHQLTPEQISMHKSFLVCCDVEGCDFSHKMTKTVERHVKEAHPAVEHKCPHCNFTFYLKCVMDNHIARKHLFPERMRFVCSVCGKRFPKGFHQKVHEQWKHGIDHDIKRYKCPVEDCSFETCSKSNLDAHRNVHTDKRYDCQYCSIKLKTTATLQRHINKVHLGIRPYLCQMCGHSFGDYHNLQSHIVNKHVTEKEFKCTHCPYGTNVKAQFAIHLFRIHGVRADFDKRKEFACPFCDYKTLMKSRLKAHVNKHTNTRNYACDECGKTFVNCDTLRSHKEWLHSEAKYSCNQCPYITKTSKRLQEHISIQHMFKGLKPFQCPYCPFTCATGGNTRKHVKKKHPTQEVRYVKNLEVLGYMKDMRKKEAAADPLKNIGLTQ
ncbi:zinc finger protein 43-like [Haliotis rubra]|uniref:zinc finger protein 43-like n=1 Tax=Haliotis rubra TaxID=36100 RepID=UPI001EE5C8DE|nr:zinc finger protein 43-like [Haliotis rubra]